MSQALFHLHILIICITSTGNEICHCKHICDKYKENIVFRDIHWYCSQPEQQEMNKYKNGPIAIKLQVKLFSCFQDFHASLRHSFFLWQLLYISCMYMQGRSQNPGHPGPGPGIKPLCPTIRVSCCPE